MLRMSTLKTGEKCDASCKLLLALVAEAKHSQSLTLLSYISAWLQFHEDVARNVATSLSTFVLVLFFIRISNKRFNLLWYLVEIGCEDLIIVPFGSPGLNRHLRIDDHPPNCDRTTLAVHTKA